MRIPSGFLMGVSAICVRRRRHQYELFNFGVNNFISGVNPYKMGMNMVPRWCDLKSSMTCESVNLV
jgi:hypothetical protein